MAFSTIPIVPVSLGIPIQFAQDAQLFLPTRLKLVPKDSSGAIFDCTSATTAAMVAVSESESPAGTSHSSAITVISADATGITVEVTASQLDNIFRLIGTNTPNYSITMNDGSTDLIAATGTIRLQLLP